MAKGKKKKLLLQAPGDALSGTVLRSTGMWYLVRLANGETHECRLRGKLRTKGIKTTNPVAVGDHVGVAKDEDGTYSITDIHDRHNYVLRRSVNLSKRAHILCANIDQAVILFSIEHPVTTLGFIDRLLVTCEAYHITPLVLFTKIDLLSEEGLARLAEYRSLYEGVGYACEAIVALDAAYAPRIQAHLEGRVSFLVGRSGAGKSSTVNLVAPELAVKVGEVSDFSGRGKHTTTFAEMFELPFGGHIIDSPGFREMQLFDFEKTELGRLFPEMRSFVDECRFGDCLHVSEPGCAVKAAVEAGKVASSRYHTYLGMIKEVDGDEW